MKINQIRPEELDQKAAEAYSKDLNYYMKNKEHFEDRFCPACGLESYEMYFSKDTFRYSKCISCACIFMNPGPTRELVDELYKTSANYKFWSEYMYPISKDERLKTIHRDRANWIASFINRRRISDQHIRVLEIGAGTGDTLSTLKVQMDFDLETFAVEPNPSMIPHLESNKIEILTLGNLESEKYIGYFDLIICFEVLEHLLEPSSLLNSLRVILKEEGLFLGSTPNGQSLEVQILKQLSTTIDIEHISVLSPAGLHSLARKCNYCVLEISTPGSFDVELLDKQNNKISLSVSGEQLSTESIQKIIKDSGFSSHMKFALSKS